MVGGILLDWEFIDMPISAFSFAIAVCDICSPSWAFVPNRGLYYDIAHWPLPISTQRNGPQKTSMRDARVPPVARYGARNIARPLCVFLALAPIVRDNA